MKKILVIFIILAITFTGTCCSSETQEYVPEPMSEETLESFKNEYQPGDMVVYSMPKEGFKNFVKNPTEEMLLKHNSSVSLVRVEDDEECSIEEISITETDISRTRSESDSILLGFPFDSTSVRVDKNTILLLGNPQSLQEYLRTTGYPCNVEKAYVVLCPDYYHVVWVKGSDCSYFIRLHDGLHSIYTPEKLTDVIMAEF